MSSASLYIAADSPLKRLPEAEVKARFSDFRGSGDDVADALLGLRDLDERDDSEPNKDPDVHSTDAFTAASPRRKYDVIRCDRVVRELFPTEARKKPKRTRTNWLDPRNIVARVPCTEEALRVALRSLAADGEGFGRIENNSKSYDVQQSALYASSVQYRCLAKAYAKSGYPSCNCIVTAFKTRDTNEYVLSQGQPHKHPPIEFLLTGARSRGLPPRVKEILRSGYNGDAYNEVDAIELLRVNGVLLDVRAATHDGVRKAMSRFVRADVIGGDGKQEFWASNYAKLTEAVTTYVVNEATLAHDVSNPARVDEVVVLDTDIGGDGGNTFVVFTTPRMLLKAASNPNVAMADGTGRLNYQGKILVVVNTIDAAQACHPIAYFLLTKGEAAGEITRGLKVVRWAIRIVFCAYLKAPTPNLHTVQANLDSAWIWQPSITVNDGADALFNSWDELKSALPAPTPPEQPVQEPPSLLRRVEGRKLRSRTVAYNV